MADTKRFIVTLHSESKNRTIKLMIDEVNSTRARMEAAKKASDAGMSDAVITDIESKGARTANPFQNGRQKALEAIQNKAAGVGIKVMNWYEKGPINQIIAKINARSDVQKIKQDYLKDKDSEKAEKKLVKLGVVDRLDAVGVVDGWY